MSRSGSRKLRRRRRRNIAANIGDISAVYKIREEVTNSSPNVEHPVKDTDGRLYHWVRIGIGSDGGVGGCATIYWISASNKNYHPNKHGCSQHSGDH